MLIQSIWSPPVREYAEFNHVRNQRKNCNTPSTEITAFQAREVAMDYHSSPGLYRMILCRKPC